MANRRLPAATSLRTCIALVPERRSFLDRSTRVFSMLYGGGEGGIRPPSRLPPSRFALRRTTRRYGGISSCLCAILHVARRAEAHASALARVSEGWRRGWDSNPRALSDKTLSRRPRYDHFGTSPLLNAGLARDRADRSRQFSILPRTTPSGYPSSARRSSLSPFRPCDIRSR